MATVLDAGAEKLPGGWHPSPKSGLAYRKETDALSIIIDGGNVFVTNRTGALIWEMIDGATTVDQIAQRVGGLCGIDVPTARAGVTAFVSALQKRGLVR